MGVLYSITNATAGTGIAQAVSASFSATAALFTMKNNGSPTSVIRPRSIRLICTVAPASGTDAQMAITIDDIARYSSGGTAYTGVPNDMRSTRTSQASSVTVGAVVLATAGANVRVAGRARVRTTIPVVGDQFVFTFGNPSVTQPSDAGSYAMNGTVPTQIPIAFPEITLGSGHVFNLHMFYASNAATGASYEHHIVWEED